MIPGFVNAAQLEHWRVSVDGAIERSSQFPLATQADNTNDTTVSRPHSSPHTPQPPPPPPPPPPPLPPPPSSLSPSPPCLSAASAQDDFYSNVFRQRLNLHQTDEAMRSVVFEAGKVAGKIASQLNGHPDGYRLYLDQALVKEPWANATGWHIDDVLWEFDSPMATTLWLALDDGAWARLAP